jgi:hypothetical protein
METLVATAVVMVGTIMAITRAITDTATARQRARILVPLVRLEVARQLRALLVPELLDQVHPRQVSRANPVW